MELPGLFSKKKTSRRPCPPEDEEYGMLVHRRFSRACGVLALLRRDLGDALRVSRELSMFKEDCQRELIDAHASDAYRGYLERDLGVRLRLELGNTPMLHAAKDEGIQALEAELLARLDRRAMEHANAFGLGVLNGAITKFARRSEPNWVYDPPIGDKSPEMTGVRAIMADFASRDDLQRRSTFRIGYLTPNRITFVRNSRAPATGDLLEQLRLEGLISGAPI